MGSSQTPFEWLPEYDGLLEQIASTDVVDAEWTRLREIIKYKLDKNISLYLTQSNENPVPPPPFSPRTLPSGGLKLPPFPPRPSRTPADGKKYTDPPKIILSPEEVNDFKESIYSQLNEFDGAPFTIQRVAELCLHPTKHYKFLGKYLRAVEKSLLVTSTWDSFPLVGGLDTNHNNTVAADTIGNTTLSSAPSTPMFSPIPFLHDDARRSRSRSPPPSPLMLVALETPGAGAIPRAEGPEPKGLGLVDELDDPSPGHLSDHPHPISATTTMNSKPLGLEDRFVKASEQEEEHHRQQEQAGQADKSESTVTEPTEPVEVKEESKGNDDMAVDDPEKENKAG